MCRFFSLNVAAHFGWLLLPLSLSLSLVVVDGTKSLRSVEQSGIRVQLSEKKTSGFEQYASESVSLLITAVIWERV